MKEQIIPTISNISIELSPILNPNQVKHITQANLGEFISLPIKTNNNFMPSFYIPSYVKEGYYIIKISIYLPDYEVYANYSNIMYLGPLEKKSSSSVDKDGAPTTEKNLVLGSGGFQTTKKDFFGK